MLRYAGLHVIEVHNSALDKVVLMQSWKYYSIVDDVMLCNVVKNLIRLPLEVNVFWDDVLL